MAISAKTSMPRAYSDDLRCKLLEAYKAGRGSLQELGKQFGVSWGTARRFAPSSCGRDASSGRRRASTVLPVG